MLNCQNCEHAIEEDGLCPLTNAAATVPPLLQADSSEGLE